MSIQAASTNHRRVYRNTRGRFEGERRSHCWKADGTHVNGVPIIKVFNNAIYGRHCEPFFGPKRTRFQDFAHIISFFWGGGGWYPRTTDPRRNAPNAGTQTPIYAWLASVRIVPILRNDQCVERIVIQNEQPAADAKSELLLKFPETPFPHATADWVVVCSLRLPDCAIRRQTNYTRTVADPKFLKKEGWGRKTMYQSRRHLSQMHTTNCMPFTQKKGGFLKKILSQ